jgi:hypothetical protein
MIKRRLTEARTTGPAPAVRFHRRLASISRWSEQVETHYYSSNFFLSYQVVVT